MLALVAHRRDGTNARLAEHGAVVLSPRAALRSLTPGDVAVARLEKRRRNNLFTTRSPRFDPPS